MFILFDKKIVVQGERSDLLRDPFRENPFMRRVSSKNVHLKKDFNVEQAHERTGRLVITHDVINVSGSSQTRSAH